jgi:hypothetical protein
VDLLRYAPAPVAQLQLQQGTGLAQKQIRSTVPLYSMYEIWAAQSRSSIAGQ